MPPVVARSLYAIVVAVVLGVGAWLRTRGVGTMALWLDEVVAANLVTLGDLDRYLVYPGSNRPTGYLLVHQAIAAVYNSELSLRLVSLVPSLLSLPLFVYVARRVLRSPGLQLLAISTLAFSPYLVTYAKEFKPYALEHALLLALIGCVVAWERRPSGRVAALFGLVAVLTALCAYGPAFVAPAYAVVLAAASLRDGRRRDALVFGAVALFCVAYVSAVALPIASQTPTKLFSRHWDRSFLPPGSVLDTFTWAAGRIWGTVVAFTTIRPPVVSPERLDRVLSVLLVLGAGASVLVLLRTKRLLVLAALLLPLLATIAGGLLGRWSLGPDRVNVFLIAPLVYLSLIAWDELAQRTHRSVGWVVAAVLVFLQLPLDEEAYRRKLPRYGAGQEEIVRAFDVLSRHAQRSAENRAVPIVVNKLARPAIEYYTRSHSALAAEYGPLLRGRVRQLRSRSPTAMKRRLFAAVRRNGTVWVFFSHAIDHERNLYRRFLADPSIEVLAKYHFPGVYMALVSARPGPARR